MLSAQRTTQGPQTRTTKRPTQRPRTRHRRTRQTSHDKHQNRTGSFCNDLPPATPRRANPSTGKRDKCAPQPGGIERTEPDCDRLCRWFYSEGARPDLPAHSRCTGYPGSACVVYPSDRISRQRLMLLLKLPTIPPHSGDTSKPFP